MFKLENINDIKIEVPKIASYNPENVLGGKVFSNPYNNIFISAYKKSGKTVVIANILKYINKNTVVYFFVPTFEKDNTYKEIQKYLDKRDITYFVFDSLVNLDEIIKSLGSEPKGENKPEYSIIQYQDGDKTITIKKRKPKMIAPDFIFVFDDISNELKNPILAAFLKKNRHTKSRIIISSQYILDLQPQARSQIDDLIIFKGIDEERLLQLYKNIDCSVSFEIFKEIYHDATTEKFNFLFYDKNKCEFRKNFNQKYIVSI
jgi:hypothetical protein